MNWTEGNLARHSRGRLNKDVILRQKEHLAKARAGLLSSCTSRKSPPTISFLPRSNDRLTHCSRSRSSRSSHSKASSGSNPAPGHALSTQKSGCGVPGPTATLFGWDPHPEVMIEESQSISSKPVLEDVLHERRRKLLQKYDWVGVNMQKPIPLKFSDSPSGSQKWSKHHERANSKVRHLLGPRYDQKQAHENKPLATQPQDITIRVGSQALRLQNPSLPSQPYKTRPEIAPTSHTPYTDNSSSTGKCWLSPSPLRKLCSKIHSLVTEPRDKVNRGRYSLDRRYSSLTSISEASRGSPHEIARHKRRRLLSTPPCIRQPTPRRMVRLLTQTSFSSDRDSADSTITQVGRPPSVSPLKREENEVWRQWVVSSESPDTIGCPSAGARGAARNCRISPGISELNRKLLTPAEIQLDNVLKQDEKPLDNTPCSPERRTLSYGTNTTRMIGSPVPERREASISPALQNRKGAILMYDGQSRACVGSGCGPQLGDTPSRAVGRTPSSDTLPPVDVSETHSANGSPSAANERLVDAAGKAKGLAGNPGTTRNAGTSQEDPDTLWRKFIFSDDESELAQTGLLGQGHVKPAEEHTQRANAGGSTDQRGRKVWASNISTTAAIGGTPIGPSPSPTRPALSCARRRDTPRHSFSSTTSNHVLDSQGGRSGEADDVQMLNFELEGATGACTGRSDFRSDSMSLAVSLAVEPARALAGESEATESSKFARPRLFIGKLSETKAADPPAEAIKPVTMAKRKRGRPRRRIGGRTNIKSIPAYAGDPIEEFEEGEWGSVPLGGEPSLFGSLETE